MATGPQEIRLPPQNLINKSKSSGRVVDSNPDMIFKSFSGTDEFEVEPFGQPATQLSPEFVNINFPSFLVTAANDFILQTNDTNVVDYHITRVSGCFLLFEFIGGGSLPIDPQLSISDFWKGVYVIILSGNGSAPDRLFTLDDIDILSGLTDENTNFSWGQHDPQPGSTTPAPDPVFPCNNTNDSPLAGTQPIVALQYINLANISVALLQTSTIPEHGSSWSADIPVDFYLNANTTYWISIIPRYVIAASPHSIQTAWCFSSQNRLNSAQRGATFEDGSGGAVNSFWSPVSSFASDNFAEDALRNVAFSITGRKRIFVF